MVNNQSACYFLDLRLQICAVISSMTVETKTFISLPDIVALDFECSRCHSHLTCGIGELERWIEGTCGNCGTPLVATNEHGHFKEFVLALQDLIKPALKQQWQTQMRLQITTTEGS